VPDLATLADVTARSPRALTSAEQTRATVLLGDASALVRTYTGQTFTTVTDDTVILRPTGAYLVLPNPPVTAVSEVRGVDETGAPGSLIVGWVWDGLERIDITTVGLFGGDPWWPWPSGPESFQVVYDHGVAAATDDVVGVVCGMVLRTILAPSPVEGMSAERIGVYSYQMSQQVGGGSTGPMVRLSEQDKEALSAYRPKVGSAQVRL
jgi:hypothetical protein